MFQKIWKTTYPLIQSVFVLNCAHGFNFPYRETIHYRGLKKNTYSRNVF